MLLPVEARYPPGEVLETGGALPGAPQPASASATPSRASKWRARGVTRSATPRWSTFDAVRLGVTPPTDVPTSIQERAYSSANWYTPPPELRKKDLRVVQPDRQVNIQ
ncbi:MAG: DUF3604 domain-containing protein [Thermoanaerobaculia bacterium]